MIHRKRVQHPGLHVIIGFLFDQFLVQVTARARNHVGLHLDACLLRQGHAPNNISRHEVIAVAVFPPAPAAIGMLEIVEPIQALFGDRVDLTQIMFAFRMRRRRG